MRCDIYIIVTYKFQYIIFYFVWFFTVSFTSQTRFSNKFYLKNVFCYSSVSGSDKFCYIYFQLKIVIFISNFTWRNRNVYHLNWINRKTTCIYWNKTHFSFYFCIRHALWFELAFQLRNLLNNNRYVWFHSSYFCISNENLCWMLL